MTLRGDLGKSKGKVHYIVIHNNVDRCLTEKGIEGFPREQYGPAGTTLLLSKEQSGFIAYSGRDVHPVLV